MHYLYRITNQLNGKVYIGQTVEDKRRWGAHKSFAKNPESTGQYIHRAMAKYGVENFIYEVVAICRTQEDANYIEDQIINQYDSRNKDKGYNLRPGGNTWDDASRQKQSEILSEYYRTRPHHTKGIKLSEEHKKKIGIGSKGHPVSNEQRKQISKALMGHEVSEKSRRRSSEVHKGKKQSEETKKKRRETCEMRNVNFSSNCVLTPENIIEIRTLYNSTKTTYDKLANQFGVASSTISDIINYRSWKNIK